MLPGAIQSRDLITPNSVCVVAILRQYYAYNSGGGRDVSRGIITIKIWSELNYSSFRDAQMMLSQANHFLSRRQVAIEVNVAIIVACLPALTPLFKRIPLLATLIPSIRSKFSHASAAERAPWPQKLSGPRHDDPERGLPAPVVKGYAMQASWKAPRAWKDAERKAFGSGEHSDTALSELDSEGSRETVQSVQAMYHAR